MEISSRVDSDLEIYGVTCLEERVWFVAGVAQRLVTVHPPGYVEILAVCPYGERAAVCDGNKAPGIPFGKIPIRLDRRGGRGERQLSSVVLSEPPA